MEDEEAEQRLDAGPLLPQEEKPKRKARRPLPPSPDSLEFSFLRSTSVQAKKPRKERVPAEEKAEEVVGEERELLPAVDIGAGIGDDPLEARIREHIYSPGQLK